MLVFFSRVLLFLVKDLLMLVMFIFGDLFVDVGNNNYVFIFVKVNYFFNGLDFL